jgi:hypothetical protein
MTKAYAAYRPSGKIQFTVTMGDNDPVPQDDEFGYIEVPVDFNGSEFHVSNGQVVPGALDDRTLDQVKTDKWNELKLKRTALEYAPITVDGKTYDADQISQQKIAGAIQLAQLIGPEFELEWTLSDNTAVALSAAELATVGISIGQRTQQIYDTGRWLRGEVHDAITKEAVEAVTWPA